MSKNIATIRKNSREELRVTVDNFHGHNLLNLRIWFQSEDGSMRPSRKGMAMRIELLPKLLEALSSVEACQ